MTKASSASIRGCSSPAHRDLVAALHEHVVQQPVVGLVHAEELLHRTRGHAHLAAADPGAPLPHAWVDDEDGHRRPVKDLVAPGRFLLIAGEDGQAARRGGRHPLDALRIGHLDGDYHNPRCSWQRHRQIASDGAVLVRPDRFIAWRHPAGTGDPRAALAAVLSQILARVFTTLRLRKTQDKCHVKVSGTEEP